MSLKDAYVIGGHNWIVLGQIRLVSAHFFKVFFESYWLWGYSVIRSEPPKNSSPGDSTFLMREKSLWDVNYFQKICPWKLVILVIRLLVLWGWVVMDQLEEAGPDNSCVQSYLVIWWIVIHVPPPAPPHPLWPIYLVNQLFTWDSEISRQRKPLWQRNIESVHCRKEGGIGKYTPEAQEIS